MQQLLVRPFQFLRPLRDDFFHLGVTAQQAQMAVHRQPRQAQGGDGAARRDRHQPRLLEPRGDRSQFVNFRLGLLIPITVHGADGEAMFARRQVGERRRSL